MTERIHGLGIGKFVAGFLGIVAMAALITGAVAAASLPSGTAHHDRTVVAGDPTGSAGATSTLEATKPPKSEPTEEPTTVPSGAPTKAPAAPVAGATCDPNLDKVEDQAEAQAEGQGEDKSEALDGKSPVPAVAPVAEASEPPSCKPADLDNDDTGDQANGKGVEPSGAPKVDDGQGGPTGQSGFSGFSGFGNNDGGQSASRHGH
jgi:hypothetical protein